MKDIKRDLKREKLIERLYFRALNGVTSEKRQQQLLGTMCRLSNSRSPEQIAKMELEKGIERGLLRE